MIAPPLRSAARLVLSVLAAACLASALAQGASDTSDPRGLIAFVQPDGRPAVVDPVTLERRALSSAAQRAQFPTWSPDGAQVSAIAFDTTGAAVTRYHLGDGSATTLYARPGEAPIYHGWSPDGAHLAILANRSDGLGAWLVPSGVGASGADAIDTAATELAAGAAGASAGSARLITTGAPLYWDWTPDGAALLTHRNVLGRGAELALTPLGGAEPEPLAVTPGAMQAPAVSPSGRWLAYATRDAGDTRRVVLQPREAGADTLRRELPHFGLAAVAWHPRRDLLAIQRSLLDVPHPYGPIALLDAVSGELEALVDDVVIAFWWSPDGASIAYLTPLAGASGSERQVDLSVQSSSLRFALWVVDIDTRLRRQLASVAPSPLFVTQYLPFFDQYARSHRLWSPSSDALVLPVTEGGVSVLRVFGLDGSQRDLGAGDMPAWNVR